MFLNINSTVPPCTSWKMFWHECIINAWYHSQFTPYTIGWLHLGKVNLFNALLSGWARVVIANGSLNEIINCIIYVYKLAPGLHSFHFAGSYKPYYDYISHLPKQLSIKCKFTCSIHTFVCSLSMNTITEKSYAEVWGNANWIKIKFYLTCKQTDLRSIQSHSQKLFSDIFRNKSKSILNLCKMVLNKHNHYQVIRSWRIISSTVTLFFYFFYCVSSFLGPFSSFPRWISLLWW